MRERHGLHKIEDWIKLSKADLHIHTKFSDGKEEISDLLEYIEAKTNVDCIAITDHDTIEGALEAEKFAENKNYRFDVIVGEEVSSLEGHILGLFLKKTIPSGLPAHKVLVEIHAQGGIAIASHPLESTRFKNPNMITMDGVGAATLLKERHHFDGIEVVNATPTMEDENIRASALNKTLLGLAETGSSDAHIKEAVGRGYTLYEGKTAKDLRRAILRRQTQGVHADWTLFVLIKYLFFFIPHGLRIALNTLVHGRVPERKDFF
jgi:predicted metal-dependent phosphoesterase TrpH